MTKETIGASGLNAATDPRLSALQALVELVPEWTEDGLCAQTDPAIFFPEKGESAKPAKSVCAQCLVRLKCLEYALENNERFGIFGGLSERERRKLRGRPQHEERAAS